MDSTLVSGLIGAAATIVAAYITRGFIKTSNGVSVKSSKGNLDKKRYRIKAGKFIAHEDTDINIFCDTNPSGELEYKVNDKYSSHTSWSRAVLGSEQSSYGSDGRVYRISVTGVLQPIHIQIDISVKEDLIKDVRHIEDEISKTFNEMEDELKRNKLIN